MKKITLLFFLLTPVVLHAAELQGNVNIPVVTYIAIGVACVLLFLLIVLWRMLDAVRKRVDDLEVDVENVLNRISEETQEKSISRADVAMMIAEQADSRASIDVKSREILVDPNEKRVISTAAVPGVIFFGCPTGERMFDDNKKCMEMTASSYYRFSLIKNDEETALVEFCPTPAGAIRALDNRMKSIEPACELIIKGDEPKNYRCEMPGRAVMKNGFWTVIRKAKVIYE